jgi:NTP pyrophosphatase (non-canonical NTP hydrolase)
MTPDNIRDLFDLVEEWGRERNLHNHPPETQLEKLYEEVAELEKALEDSDIREIEDGIGDCMVVLVQLAACAELDAPTCLLRAYIEIRNRTGQTRDGLFVKSQDTDEEL